MRKLNSLITIEKTINVGDLLHYSNTCGYVISIVQFEADCYTDYAITLDNGVVLDDSLNIVIEV